MYTVRKGDTLLRLDDTRFRSNKGESEADRYALTAQVERLSAEAEGRPFKLSDEVIAKAPQVAEDERSLYEQRQRRLASEIRNRLVQGADFAAQARTYSQDSKAASGGDWGTVQRSALAPQLAEVAFSIPVKTVSQVFEFRGFYYLMVVEERQPGQLKPQAEIDDLLDRLVQADLKKKAMDEFLLKLRKAEIYQMVQ